MSRRNKAATTTEKAKMEVLKNTTEVPTPPNGAKMLEFFAIPVPPIIAEIIADREKSIESQIAPLKIELADAQRRVTKANLDKREALLTAVRYEMIEEKASRVRDDIQNRIEKIELRYADTTNLLHGIVAAHGYHPSEMQEKLNEHGEIVVLSLPKVLETN